MASNLTSKSDCFIVIAAPATHWKSFIHIQKYFKDIYVCFLSLPSVQPIRCVVSPKISNIFPITKPMLISSFKTLCKYRAI